MSAIATVRAAPGLDAYLDDLEDRLAEIRWRLFAGGIVALHTGVAE